MAGQLAHKPDQFQLQAIESTARGIRIVAPAGSGKSETLARRVAKRIDKDGVDPKRILILTFDNAAKKSLSGFFGQLLDRSKLPEVRSLNQHGLRILRNHFPQENTTSIESDNAHAAWQVVGRYNNQGRSIAVLNWDGVNRQLVDVLGAMKEQGFYPGRDGEIELLTRWLREEYFRLPEEAESASIDDLWGMPTNRLSDDNNAGQLRKIIELAVDFEREMRGKSAMQLIDQKARAAHSLLSNHEIQSQLQAEFDEIIVDECQDISRLDAILINSTAGPQTRVVLAGDDDQTLYEWRHAHSLYLRKPEIVFGDLDFETVHLDLNYRSPAEILDPAVRLISHNVERIEKSPMSAVTSAGTVDVVPRSSAGEINLHVVETIRDELRNGRPALDIAVLCHQRSERDQKTPIERMLRQAGVPVVEVDQHEQVKKPGVWVRSFLKAKGRQWPVVLIPGANDRDVPDNDSLRRGEVEAIRRRFYVAMTRASEKLVVSYIRGGDVDRIDFTAEGETVSTNGATRFLFEAGVVTVDGPTELAAPVEMPAVIAEPAQGLEDSAAVNLQVVGIEPTRESDKSPQTTADSVPKPEPVEEPQPEAGRFQRTPEPVVKPEPVATLLSPLKKGKLKDWEPRHDDTRKLNKAKSEFAAGDYDTAILCAWKPIESVLRRMVKVPQTERSADAVSLIDEAVAQRVIDLRWKDDLHLWRQIRNQAFHDDDKRVRFSPERFKDIGFSLVNQAGEFFDHLAQRHAPKQLAFETQDEFLTKLSNLVTLIQLDRPSPIKKKPIRAIRFDPDQNQYEVLAMQMLMVLRDVRFYVPEEYRWSTSPVIGQFAVGAVGHLPNNMRPSGRNRLKLQPGEQLNQLMARFDRMVMQECGDVNPGDYVTQRLEDGLLLENGNFHAGLKLNPRTKV